MKKKIAIVLYDGLASLDVTGPADVFSAATMMLAHAGRDNEGYDLSYQGMTQLRVKTASGLSFCVDGSIGSGHPLDTLIVPGGPTAEAISDSVPFLAALKRDAEKAKRVVSVCTGAFLLAACGLLHSKRATTHWLAAERLAEKYPDIRVEADAIYVRDGRISSSAGVTAGIDLALALVEEDHGPLIAMEIARLLLLYRRRPGTQSQFSTPLATQTNSVGRFAKLCLWMENNLTKDLHVDHLAERVAMSPRHFARTFSSETGISPARYVEELRLGHARELLESGAVNLGFIAQQSGFGREERLRRTFQRRLGVNPRHYAEHFHNNEGSLP
ncbi:GlxA family transcriptional regulator [Pseudodesulfovibrio piezophilus]|nr:DJ-1/PfpI family protein [Pseudodesulfovibrio piezophilus]